MLQVYAYSVLGLEISLLVSWALNYVEWHAKDDPVHRRWARWSLASMPKALIWPHFLVKTIIAAIQETMRDGKPSQEQG